jgi:hypothetical protein
MRLGKDLALNDHSILVIELGVSQISNQHMSTVIGLVRTSLNEQCLPVIERGFYTAQ